MGRYVTGDFDWKFAVGDQSSSFGIILDEICSGLEVNYLNRYIGSQGEGEKIELSIYDSEEILKACKKFVGKGFKVKSKEELEKWCKVEIKFSDEYWDKLMIRKFIKERDDFKGDNGETLYFDVEY